MTKRTGKMRTPRRNVFVAKAAKVGRDYITPEDVSEALKTVAVASVRKDLLGIIGRQFDIGAEDPGLCAFIAWRGR